MPKKECRVSSGCPLHANYMSIGSTTANLRLPLLIHTLCQNHLCYFMAEPYLTVYYYYYYYYSLIMVGITRSKVIFL